MIHSRSSVASLVLFFAGACGGAANVEWSEPSTKTAEQRPIEWDSPTKKRLGLSDMSGASAPSATGGGASKTFVAQSPPDVWLPQPAQPERFKDLVWRIATDANSECYLTARPVGPVAVNLSRWYKDQFGLAEVPAVEALPVVELAGKPGRLVELSGTFRGTAGQAMLLAFLSESEQITTTLKFTGPEATVKAHRDSFLALAKSLRSASPSPNPAAPPIDRNQPLPDGHPPIDAPTKPAPSSATDPHGAPKSSSAAPFVATIPAGWQAKSGSSRPLHHTFGTEGEVYVSQLGGSLKQNVEIWRSEMSLPTPTEAELAALPKVPMLDGEGVLLDMTGDLKGMTKQLAGARVLVAAQQSGNTILFAKLAGKAADVEAQKAAFLEFCKSLRRSP